MRTCAPEFPDKSTNPCRGFVQQTLGKNGADTLALSSIQKVAVTVRLLGTEPVERRLGAEKLHEAYGTDRNKARIMRQQTQDSGFGHRIAAGRIPDKHADDFMAARNSTRPKRIASLRTVMNNVCKILLRETALGKANQRMFIERVGEHRSRFLQIRTR